MIKKLFYQILLLLLITYSYLLPQGKVPFKWQWECYSSTFVNSLDNQIYPLGFKGIIVLNFKTSIINLNEYQYRWSKVVTINMTDLFFTIPATYSTKGISCEIYLAYINDYYSVLTIFEKNNRQIFYLRDTKVEY